MINDQRLINSTSPYFPGDGRIVVAAGVPRIVYGLVTKVGGVNNSIIVCAGAVVVFFAGK